MNNRTVLLVIFVLAMLTIGLWKTTDIHYSEVKKYQCEGDVKKSGNHYYRIINRVTKSSNLTCALAASQGNGAVHINITPFSENEVISLLSMCRGAYIDLSNSGVLPSRIADTVERNLSKSSDYTCKGDSKYLNYKVYTPFSASRNFMLALDEQYFSVIPLSFRYERNRLEINCGVISLYGNRPRVTADMFRICMIIYSYRNKP